jgi:hypothetical protein
MKLHEFVNVIRDDASRFNTAWQRSAADHAGLFIDDQEFEDWLRAFVLYARQEEQARRARTKR